MRRPAFHLLLLVVVALVTLSVPGVQPLFAQQPQTTPAPTSEPPAPTAQPTAPTAPTAQPTEPAEQPLTPDFVPGQLIIKFQPSLTPEEIQAFYTEYGLTEIDDLDPAPSDADRPLKLTFVSTDVDQSLIDTLERDPRVIYAEP